MMDKSRYNPHPHHNDTNNDDNQPRQLLPKTNIKNTDDDHEKNNASYVKIPPDNNHYAKDKDDDETKEEGEEDTNDDDDDDDDEEEDNEEEDNVERKVLPQRMTRGQRMTRLVGEAAEADDSFWGQAAFDEDMSDEEYTSSSQTESETSTDSDIDLPEPDDDEGNTSYPFGRGGKTKGGKGNNRDDIDEDDDNAYGTGGGNKRGGRGGGRGGGGRGRYVDPALRGHGNKSFNIGTFAAAALAAQEQNPSPSNIGGENSSNATGDGVSQPSDAKSGTNTVIGRSFRRSTTEKVASSAAERQMEEELLAKEKEIQLLQQKQFSHPLVDENGVPVTTIGTVPTTAGSTLLSDRRLTQTEILTDAAHTTIESLRQLDSLLRIENERQAKDNDLANRRHHRHIPNGTPLLRFHSKRGYPTTITFTEVDYIPTCINTNMLTKTVNPSTTTANTNTNGFSSSSSTLSSHTTTAATQGVPSATLPGEYPKPRKCVITGKPAKYMDPLTKEPYADLAAFKQLRLRYQQQQQEQQQQLENENNDDDDHYNNTPNDYDDDQLSRVSEQSYGIYDVDKERMEDTSEEGFGRRTTSNTTTKDTVSTAITTKQQTQRYKNTKTSSLTASTPVSVTTVEKITAVRRSQRRSKNDEPLLTTPTVSTTTTTTSTVIDKTNPPTENTDTVMTNNSISLMIPMDGIEIKNTVITIPDEEGMMDI